MDVVNNKNYVIMTIIFFMIKIQKTLISQNLSFMEIIRNLILKVSIHTNTFPYMMKVVNHLRIGLKKKYIII